MATKVVITDYVDSLLGTSGTSVSDALIMGGMEDVIRKLELTSPQSLRDLETTTTITSTPVTLHYIPPTIDVYVGDERAVRRDNKQHVSSRYSLLNDYGETTYYWTTGNQLNLHPFDSDKTYTYRGVAYAVSGGNLTWADRYNYPLALYCAMFTSYKNIVGEIGELIDDASGFESGALGDATNNPIAGILPSGPNDTIRKLYDRVIARLNKHDIELSTAELDVIKTQISAYQATLQRDYTLSMKMQSRAAIFDKYIAMYTSLKQQYNEWFAQIQEAKQ